MSSLRTIVRSCAIAIAAAAVIAVAAAPATAAPTHYVETSDGASIAINVKVPPHCNALNKCPTFFEMSGYESGSDEGKTPAGHLADQTGLPFPLQTGTRAAHASHVDDRYVTVLASVRGTGCSSGEFDLFSWRSALDGKEVIDKWIAKQPWSNGKVVIFGHSYSGITGLFVASTRPEALRAVSSSGLIGDLYRDIVYPGGVTNYGFPLLWTGAIRVAYDVGGGTLGGLYPLEDTSAKCAANQAERRRALLEDPLIHGLDDTDGNWYHSRSLVNYVDRINVPVHITSAYQDEQTGPRGPTNVFDHLSSSISKRLVLTNGVHGTNTEDHVFKDRIAWMDYWMLNKSSADLDMKTGTVDLATEFGPKTTATKTSRVILGYQGGGKAVGEIRSDGFPLGQTQFTDAYTTDGGRLVFDHGLRRARQREVDQRLSPPVVLLPGRREPGRRGLEPDRPGRGRAVDLRLPGADRDRRPDHGAPVRLDAGAGHRAVRAAHRPCTGRHAALPEPRHAAGQPPPDRRGRVAEDGGRADLPAVATARDPPGRAFGPGDGLPDRRVPGRARVPPGP